MRPICQGQRDANLLRKRKNQKELSFRAKPLIPLNAELVSTMVTPIEKFKSKKAPDMRMEKCQRD
jgi:hypothetical protein